MHHPPGSLVMAGDRRKHRLDLRFALGSITEADARALALGIFRGVAPSGAARALDERLEGAITDLSRRRMFSGNVGEIFILPTGHHPISADLVAFVGLGPFDRFNEDVLQIAAENLLRTFVNTRVEEFATVLFGGGSGKQPGSILQHLLAGFLRGLRDADTDHGFRRVIICERDPERYATLKRELFRLSRTSLCRDVELTFDEVVLRTPPTAPPSTPQEDPVYLIVREEASRDGKFDVRSSVLTAGQKATVVTGLRAVAEGEFEGLRQRLVDPGVIDLEADGLQLGKLLLAGQVLTALPRCRDRHLVVVHDAPLSGVPWETIALAEGGRSKGIWMPAAAKGLSHRYAADNLSVAKWLEGRRQDRVLTVLLVVNPTGDLAGAEEEGKRVQAVFRRVPGAQIDLLRGRAASRPALLAAFRSGKFDVIHYAGHAFFDEAKPERSGILCHGGELLAGADLARLGNLPTLVFFNACEAGRVRPAAEVATAPGPGRSRVQRIGEAVGLAEAFMRGGVANFLGTYWPVGDAAARLFAETFYKGVAAARPLGEAIQAGRAAVRRAGSKDWADYVFYGNPDFVLKEGGSHGQSGT